MQTVDDVRQEISERLCVHNFFYHFPEYVFSLAALAMDSLTLVCVHILHKYDYGICAQSVWSGHAISVASISDAVCLLFSSSYIVHTDRR